MTIGDLSAFCRLCLMPLINGSYIDCAQDENSEFKETIKTLYNIDINAVDEFSTNVCLLCCDVLMYNMIHYHRAVEAQKSLTRVQRIKNKLRKLGKKKSEKKSEKKPLPESSTIIDVEMVEVEPICSKPFPVEDCEMDVSNELNDSDANTNEVNDSSANIPPPEPNPPVFFVNITSFGQSQWPAAANPQMTDTNAWNCPTASQDLSDTDNGDDMKKPPERLPSPPKRARASNNKNEKQSPSFFQMAKTFCGNIMKKQKNVECGLDEITNKMALLRFTA